MKKRNLLFLIFVLAIVFILLLTQVKKDIEPEELKDKYTDDLSKFIEINGLEVHYKDMGDAKKPVLLLLHGIASSLHVWDGWAAELEEHYRIITLDLPGFGLTGPDEDCDFSQDYYSDFLCDFLDELGIEKCHIAGNSMGGWISWGMARAYPERIEKMILLNAAGYPFPDKISFIFDLAKHPILKYSVHYVSPRFLIKQTLEEVYFNKSQITEDIITRYHELSRRRGNRKALVDCVCNNLLKNEEQHYLIQGIKTPTLVLWGDRDRWISVENAFRFEADLENASCIIYENVGHVPMEEIAARSAADAHDFLMA